MASRNDQESQQQPIEDRARAAQLNAEWANVGLCGGMFRPVNGAGEAPVSPARAAYVGRQQRNQRCCR